MKVKMQEKEISVTKKLLGDGNTAHIKVVHKYDEFDCVIPITWYGFTDTEESAWSYPDVIGNQTQAILNKNGRDYEGIPEDVVAFCKRYAQHIDLYDAFQAVGEAKSLAKDFEKADSVEKMKEIAEEIDKWAGVIKAFCPNVRSRKAYDNDGSYSYLQRVWMELVIEKSFENIEERDYNNVF